MESTVSFLFYHFYESLGILSLAERCDIRSIASWKEYKILIATWKYAHSEITRRA